MKNITLAQLQKTGLPLELTGPAIVPMGFRSNKRHIIERTSEDMNGITLEQLKSTGLELEIGPSRSEAIDNLLKTQTRYCKACNKPLIPSGHKGQYRDTQRFCGPKCSRPHQPITYRPIEERFQKRVIVEPAGFSTPCWRWTGSFYTTGYGRIRDAGANGKLWATHIYSFVKKYGPVPAGKVLDHLCRNRWCCNPDHLEPVTVRENNLRGHAPTVLIHHTGMCRNGHVQNEQNTYRYKHGDRKGKVAFCKACKTEKRALSAKVKEKDFLREVIQVAQLNH